MSEQDREHEWGYNRLVGERIRSIRRQKRLSLQEVEARSDSEFKASVLGAYERGERAISVSRLHRLASFYSVPVDQMLPGEGSREGLGWGPVGGRNVGSERLVIDLMRLANCVAPEAELINRYLTLIQVERQDFNGHVLTIRRDDVQALAAILGRTIDEAVPRLRDLGLLRDQGSE